MRKSLGKETMTWLAAIGLALIMGGCTGREKPPARSSGAGPAVEPEAVSLLGKPLFSPPPGESALKNYEEAKRQFEMDPSEENIIWLGRRAGYLGRYREALKIISAGLAKYPDSYRLLRHRGHRFITLRRFQEAADDLAKAAALAQGKPREIEPDGAPNKLNLPLSNTHFNIWYHLGLAYYLLGRFEDAEAAYRQCQIWSDNSDLAVATADWLYMTLRRLKKDGDAARLLDEIRPDLTLVENDSYYDRLLMYKGKKSPEDLLQPAGDTVDEKNLAFATQGYGVGNWYHCNGNWGKAAEVFQKVISSPNWAAFGFIAAEADLARMRK